MFESFNFQKVKSPAVYLYRKIFNADDSKFTYLIRKFYLQNLFICDKLLLLIAIIYYY